MFGQGLTIVYNFCLFLMLSYHFDEKTIHNLQNGLLHVRNMFPDDFSNILWYLNNPGLVEPPVRSLRATRQ